ncbi:MAG: methylglutaconyl-CoA hydratase [Oceanospirillaceae bacterium]|jgi:methylglutaconyl-CoA hydratase
MNQEKVILEINDVGLATLTLNRAELRNAFDDEMIQSLINYLAQIKSNPAVKILLLKAEGKHFSAGADLNWMARMAQNSSEQNFADAQQLAKLMSDLNHLPIPSVAVIQGAAYGGAVGLAACCDMVFATATTNFCLSEVKLGLIPAAISPYVIRAIGERQARRYFISAEIIPAHKAQALGLVHEVTEDTEQMQHLSQLWLENTLKNGPKAMQSAKKLALEVSLQPLDKHLSDDTAKRIADIRATDEAIEGLSAFLEKRKAHWS